MIKKSICIGIFSFLFISSIYAQTSKIVIENSSIGINELFTISIVVDNEEINDYSTFPIIPGMVKKGTSSSSSTTIINGQVTMTQRILQSYLPTKEGKIILEPFTMKVNGKAVYCPGTTIVVGPPVTRKSSSFFDQDPFENFFEDRNQPSEFVDVKDKAFFALTPSKKQIYVGEGVTVTLAFYVAEDNQAEMQFYELPQQLARILKQIKPDHCWEENFMIQQVEGELVQINGKNYMQYKLYEAVFYPFTLKDIVFPSLDLKLIKYKIAKNPSFFGDNRQESFKTFTSAQKIVHVKELPSHPLRDQVAVGNFQLIESIQPSTIEAGKGFRYTFKIVGEGNIASIGIPKFKTDSQFLLYEPTTHQNITRSMGKVTGDKTFTYYGVAQDTGVYKISNYIQWTFFNPTTGKYQTLIPTTQLRVSGKPPQQLDTHGQDVFLQKYGMMDLEQNNKMIGPYSIDWMNIFIFIFIGIASLTIIYLVIKK